MARRYSSDSSDDDARGEYCHRRSRTKQQDERHKDVGKKSSDEEGELIERDRGSQRNERKLENGCREREKGNYRDERDTHRHENEH
ncbi:pre-mRNA-splicing factor CWC22-like protein [Pyrus ussuriensis x Pyrus communis]|uniref:Pre-mRNA-splicing factor CWC22-like protein n=1 Tax=Pyrus ussuriensis x Pyrus communis TaxID=2448454 RepID=A0A5N5GBS4_9ROSA|nr:pre-mRNA-splicing factor CWC22-like protein [Pyrus ussuriensis x Pyrus communis]